MQLISLAPHAIVDFAHNPDGLTRALEAMDRPGNGKVMIVFGATGERDHLKRPIMGAIAAQNADIVIVTDDDPHGEEPAPIRAAVEEGAQKAQNRRAQQILNISRDRRPSMRRLPWPPSTMRFSLPAAATRPSKTSTAWTSPWTTVWRPLARCTPTASRCSPITAA